MQADWVAATVRGRSMAQRRLGAGACRSLSTLPNLPAAVEALAGSVYAGELAAARTLQEAQLATRRTVLWQLRVLAGWLPANGTPLVRAVAARFEADNIVALAAALSAGTPPDEAPDRTPGPSGYSGRSGTSASTPFDLGGLATAWPRLRTAESLDTLQPMLAASPWGSPGPADSLSATLPDTLAAVWLRRVASAAPEARPWAVAAAVLLVARLLLVDGGRPTERQVSLLRPLIGTGWAEASSLPELLLALSPAAGQALAGVQDPRELWRAEAALAGRVETDGFSLLRAGLPGPGVVLGAAAVLAADAWRVRAALAAAGSGGGGSEVLDAVA
ncbi:hypothetical protein LJ756_03460 [Arthrobacter sp. zg-Y411]|uniref:hypothetical protein n=1 Tax=Arthrobacter zhangbolii TaxID=2886936 RepID=UPI001D132AF9|nr:hypothetical protein [Arthrobacter zhangbolii]MCC3293673.1 hypothetical protein [Arthrobacter zhangbolii]